MVFNNFVPAMQLEKCSNTNSTIRYYIYVPILLVRMLNHAKDEKEERRRERKKRMKVYDMNIIKSGSLCRYAVSTRILKGSTIFFLGTCNVSRLVCALAFISISIRFVSSLIKNLRPPSPTLKKVQTNTHIYEFSIHSLIYSSSNHRFDRQHRTSSNGCGAFNSTANCEIGYSSWQTRESKK